MKKLLVLVLTMAIAGSAFAVVDPDPNSVGFYADLTADTVGATVDPFSTTPVYVILTMADFDELYGIEYGYEVVGDAVVLATIFANPQALDVGQPGNHIVGFGSPTECTEATLIATMNVLYTNADGAPVTITLTGTEPSSVDPDLPTLLLANGVLMTSGDSTDIGNVNFGMNYALDIVATEPMTIDSVKSLYR